MSLKSLISKYKTDLLIHLKYPKRYVNSTILSYIPESVTVGNNVTIKPGVTISSLINKIGNYVYIGDRSSILNVKEIGNYSSISHNVKIGVDNHLLTAISTNSIFYDDRQNIVSTNFSTTLTKTNIGPDVLISADVIILSGINLGVGCVVGANSFVNKDVPPYAIVAGSPAKIIGYRFDEELREMLIESNWWEKDFDKIKEFNTSFGNPYEFLSKIKNVH